GTTMQYWPHQAVDVTMNQRDPDRIMLRDIKLDIIGGDMESDPKIRIQYAAKYQSISNSWKKWQGEIKGLKRLDAVNKKLAYEEEFKKWAQQNNTWDNTYEPVFNAFEELYTNYATYIKAYDYYREIVMSGVEVFKQARTVNSIINNIENDQGERAESIRSAMLSGLPGFYKDFNQPTDEDLFAALMPELINGLDASFLPAEVVETINQNDREKLIKKVYQKSILTDRKKLEELLENGSEKQLLKLRKDPLIAMYNQLNFIYEKDIITEVRKISKSIDDNMKVYMAGLMEMKKGQAFYPDANLTLRVAYGQVEGYEPKDGVKYKYYTTLTGIMEKDNPEIYDYDVPDRLKELYQTKDFGQYEVNGDVPVCFTASNHTTGGNSGSPVVNGNGELIGVNFDRCWEGTMSDIMYDPERCRNISIDIRYALFIIDKFAGAGYLLDEMEIVK
uniref:S46 family peptidase n=1 Tax=Draconibacterium sp. TaxID=1965318 RepID=UPI00356A496A